MLPIRKIGSPNSDFWAGLIDGVYAIAMTLVALELPGLIGKLIEEFYKHSNDLLFISILIGFEIFTYALIFLVLYEIWSFHKASLVTSGMKIKGQNLINSLILVISCVIPGQIIFNLDQKTDLVINKLGENISNNKPIIQILIDSPSGEIAFFTLCSLSFLLIYLYNKSVFSINHDKNVGYLLKSSLRRSVIFICFIVFSVVLGRFIPAILITSLYVGYVFYERN
tara:strand:+ start:2296 stop:2970 length:675 start_codon:yes stop_codon:yes gene_type:complete